MFLRLSLISSTLYTSAEIEAEISHLSSNDDSLRAHLDTLKRSCQALQQEVTDATLYLPKYSLKRAQEVSALVQNIHYNIIPIFPCYV